VKSVVLRITSSFAAAGYFVAVALQLTPPSWRLSPSLVYSVCPPAFATITVDPSWMAVLVVIGPANALIYGILGLVIGVLSSQFHYGRNKTLVASASQQEPVVRD
jgi:hypothetical protein